MSTYRVTGVTKENGSPVSALIGVYKADRDEPLNMGQLLGKGLSDDQGNFEVTWNDWAQTIFVTCLDLTLSPTPYNGVILDWTTGEYAGNDPSYDKVQVLLHLEGTDGGISFIDEIGKTFTALGNAETSSTQAKFGGTSLKLSGVDLIETVADEALNILDFDFCLEAWVLQTSQTGNQVVFDSRGVSGYAPWLLRIDSGVPTLWMSSNGSSWNIRSSITGPNVPLNTWTHVALVRYNGSIRMYINGVGNSAYSSSAVLMSQQYSFKIGNNSSLTEGLVGYVDEVRFTIGDGRYDANFFPPTNPFPAGGDQYFQYVKSLIHFNGDDLGTAFIDEIGNSLGVVGTPVTSTSEFKFGTASLLLDESSKVIIPYNSSMNVQFANFTFEAWSFNTAAKDQTYRYIVDKRPDGAGFAAFIIRIYNGYYQIYVRNGASSWVSTSTAANTVAISQWQHVALTRSDGKVRFFIDGVKVWESTFNVAIPADTDNFEIGKTYKGNIDDIRLTVGIARYVEDFPVPTKEFDNQ